LTSPDAKTHNQIDYILIDRRQHLCVLYVRLFRTANCDTDHYLVVAKVRERLAVSKQRFHMERFNLKKLNNLDDKEQYHVEVSNMFTPLEVLCAEVDINSALETIRENIKISAKESRLLCNEEAYTTV
jgi:hypothetical protein